MPAHPLAPALPLLLTAALAAGCGAPGDSASDFEGEEKDVAQVVEDLQTAGRDDEARRVCTNLLTTGLARRLQARGGSCSEVVQRAFDGADSTDLSVTDVRISGGTARARVAAGRDGDQDELVELVRERGAWRISRFGGVVR